eukprot:SAG31_NODE_715_length_12634_cov_5.289190_8_plen_66_part_00
MRTRMAHAGMRHAHGHAQLSLIDSDAHQQQAALSGAGSNHQRGPGRPAAAASQQQALHGADPALG